MKVLIIRFSSIGDIVLCTPVIRACYQQLNAEVHFLTKAKFSNVLQSNPYIYRTHSFKNDLTEVKSELIIEDFDLVVDLHNNIRSAQVKAWLRKPSSTFPKLNLKKWLYVNVKVNSLPKIHIVDRYFQACPGVENDGQGLDYFIDNSNIVNLGIEPFAALILGATYYTKRIPEDILREIIPGINSPVVLIGGPEEQSLGEQLATEYENVVNACGKYNINQSASIVNQSQYVVASDTGMMHIASALKKPIAMVWGNTVPDFGMGPYGTEAQHFEVLGLSCRPCSKLGKSHCPKGHFKCMKDQDVGRLVDLVNRNLS